MKLPPILMQNRVSELGTAALIALLYWASVFFVTRFVATEHGIGLFNPASGIALASLLVGGLRFWPAIFVGSWLAYATTSLPIFGALWAAVASTLEAVVAVWLLRRGNPFNLKLIRIRDFYRLWFTAFSVALIGGVGGTLAFYSCQLIPVESITESFIAWWRGDSLGIILITPLLLVWRTLPREWFRGQPRVLEFVVLYGLVLFSGQVIFFGWLQNYLGQISQGYWFFLYISIAAIRFGRHGALLVLAIVTLQGVTGTALELGFFATDLTLNQLASFWFYIQVVALVGVSQAIILEENRYQASFDALTGLPNRRLFLTRLRQELALTHRNENHLALIFIDLDRFKEVNDAQGHQAGDDLLRKVAGRLEHCVRESDTVARIGGDEFTIIIPNITDFSYTDRIAQNVLRELRKPFKLNSQEVFISASLGVTIYPNDSVKSDELLKYADQAMYAAKAAGKDGFHYFTPTMQESAVTRSYLAHDLRIAVASRQLCVHYQPVIDMVSGKVVKVEALLRWNHPTRGMIEPATFIGIAEETGSIHMIGEWVFKEVVNQVAVWREESNWDRQVSVNMSPLQFSGSQGNQWMIDLLSSYQLPPESIAIEITEGVLLNDRVEVINELKRFYDAGIEIAIDDFGTGYSSLSYLKKYPVSYLKIDRSFVDDVVENESTKSLVQAIVSMAHALNLKVIAEGIETLEQHEFMLELGCDYAQGFLYAAPLPAGALEALLLQRESLCEKKLIS